MATFMMGAMLMATPCPSPSTLEERLTLEPSGQELRAMLRACAALAESRRAVIAAAEAVLAVGEQTGMAAAAKAVLATAAAAPRIPLPASLSSPPPSPPQSSSGRSSGGGGGGDVKGGGSSNRRKLTTWHESVEDQQAAQLAQARAVATRRRAHKLQTLIPVSPAVPADAPHRWEVECEPLLYGLGLPAVPRCTPLAPSADAARPMACGRVMRDHFLDENEQTALITTVERTMRGLFHQGAQTSFAPEAKSAARHMGAAGHALFASVLQRVRRTLESDFGVARLYSAGSLLTRIWADERVPRDGMDVEPGHRYDNPHVDKANRASYDYSALLYLNSHCHADPGAPRACDYDRPERPDFDGGRFVWVDEGSDLVVEPRAGRLLTFSGGTENLHHGSKVLNGTRYVLGFWFTCHAELEYEDDEDVVTEPLPKLPLPHEPLPHEPLPPASDTAPPVPPRRRRPSSGAAAHDLPPSATVPPPVPARRHPPGTRAGGSGSAGEVSSRRAGLGDDISEGRGSEVSSPRAGHPDEPESTGMTEAQCIANSPNARAAIAHREALRSPAQTALGAEIDASHNPRPAERAAAGARSGPAAAATDPSTTAAAEASELTPDEADEADEAARPPRYVDGLDLEARPPSAAEDGAVDHRRLTRPSDAWRGYDLPGFPDGTPAPFEEGYEGGYGLDDQATMEEAIEAYAAALERYDAVHGPPMESAEDEARLKRQRTAGMPFHPLYPEKSPGGEDVHANAEDAWDAMVAHDAARRAPAYGERRSVNDTGEERLGGGSAGRRSGGAAERTDCGFPGITEAQCVQERGCRWDDSRVGVPWCFEA
jgi:hypothetical protein